MPVDDGQGPEEARGEDQGHNGLADVFEALADAGGRLVLESDEDGFASYDPLVDRPTDEDGQAQQDGVLYDPGGKRLPTFSPRHTEDFDGLMYLGALTRRFDWLGHTFVIRTLNSDDLLAIPMVIKGWNGTIGEAKAYAIAMAGMCVVTVDGQTLPMPVGGDSGEYAWAHQRFNYAKTHWFQFTIDRVYSEYLALEARAQDVIEAMEKASGSTESLGNLSDISAGPNDKDF